jgi:hypothetical protein
MSDQCECFFCNKLDIEGIDVSVGMCVEHIADTVHTVDQLYEACYALFNKAYMLGYQSAVVERLEQDMETLRFMKNKK